ncbi:MAG: TolC family protein [Armatimonadetes bacterium]|nr:TolC family protein [Armatimonadota bacterium]NIM23831.1 TolC family protein [Armatimonadota bacterium]NIM67710.1 TolC family protein [Armatimonadota bacterium]NIM76219.1 TolC family protein [Armatimonadota bacterium]NIN05912.1 TolC family protein [Armatimonadota bacterium]
MNRARIWISLIALCILLAGRAAQADASKQTSPEPEGTTVRLLSLEEAVSIALKNNPTVLIAEQQVRRAGGQVTEARSGLWPRLSASATHTRTGPISTVEIPTPTGTEEIEISVPEATRYQLTLSLPLDISGQIRAATSAASLNLLAQEFALAAVRQSVALEVQEAYLGVLRAESLKSVADEALAAAREHLRVAKLNFEAGTVAYFDVLRAEVQVANFQQRLVEAENGVELAKSSLNFTMGEDVNQPLEVESPAEISPAAPPPVEESQQEADARRPELLQARAQVEAAEKGIRIAKAGLRPSLALVGNRNYDENPSAFGGLKRTWDATAALSIPLFDSGETRGRLKQARADEESARRTEELTRNQVMLEVRQAHLSILEATERMRVAEKDVEQAREALRLAQLRYQSGLSTSVEVTDAEVALAQSMTNQVNAYYDYLLAQARLQKAVGAPLQETAQED